MVPAPHCSGVPSLSHHNLAIYDKPPLLREYSRTVSPSPRPPAEAHCCRRRRSPGSPTLRRLAAAGRHRVCTWSICAAMTIDGWLPCTGVKQGYFQTSDLLNWLKSTLLPTLRVQSPDRPRIIVLDNCSTHIDEAILEAIESEGHLIRFL